VGIPGYQQFGVARGGAAVGFYQRCGWRICETVDRDFEPATVPTKSQEPSASPCRFRVGNGNIEESVCSGVIKSAAAVARVSSKHTWRGAERWGGLAGAVAIVEADGRYCHLILLEGLIGSESI
jgi:hypothetical protein